jgi:hypothetical protein
MRGLSTGTNPTNAAVYLSDEYLPVAGSTFCAVDVLPATRKPGMAASTYRVASAPRLGDRGQHLGDRARDARGDDLAAHVHARFADGVALAVGDVLDEDRLEQLAAVGDGAHGHGELERGHADALAEAGGRRLGVDPGAPLRSQHAAGLARERQAGLLAEAEAPEGGVERGLAELQPIFSAPMFELRRGSASA